MVERDTLPPPLVRDGRTAERRVTSILFADLVGFTPFAEVLDPEDVRDFLSGYFDRCRDIIQRYGGTVEKFIGDAVMAVWGVPTAHEHDAERAVRAGLELAEMIGPYGAGIGATSLRLRVGIATGEVAVTLGAVGQGMVSGDAVNTASRVQAKATPGEVWVDEQTIALTTATIRYESQGEHQLKGKVRPLKLHRVTAVASAAGIGPLADQLVVPMAGYRREFTQIEETWHATVEEQRGRLLLVVGEPGVGKTRLALELQAYLDRLSTSIYWHWGQCVTFGEGVVYSALVHAVRNRIGVGESDDPDLIAARIDGSLREIGTSDTDRAWLAPRIAALLGLEAGVFSREDLFAAWLQWFQELGSDGSPIVWVVDDAHYGDDALLDFMEHLARSATTPVLVLALTRPDLFDRRPRFGSGRRASLLNLDGLNNEAMADLVDALIENLPADQRHNLIRQADGIPLYAIETVRAMLDQGNVNEPEPGRRVLVEETAPASMPASLQVLVSSRLDLLPATDRAVLQDAAVLGPVFDRNDLLFLTGLQAHDLDDVLARLTHRDLVGTVTDRFSPHTGSYAFVQSVVRQVAYDLLSRRDRIDRHVRIANHLMDQEVAGDRAAIVAQHLTDAIALTGEGDPLRLALADQRASWLERAGDRARSVGAHREALRLYEISLEHLVDPDAKTRLLLRAAEAAYSIGNFEVAIARARAVETTDRSMAAAATAIEVRALRNAGFGRESVDALRRYPSPASLDGIDPTIASRIAFRWVAAIFDGLDDGDARDWAECAYQCAARAGYPEGMADALNGFFLHYVNQPDLAGLRALFLDEVIRISREHHLTVSLYRGLTNQAAEASGHDLALCLRNYREVVRLARQSGYHDWTSVSDGNLCHVLWLAGEWDECLRVEAERPQPEGDFSIVEHSTPQIPAVLIAHARGASPEPPPAWLALESQASPSPYVARDHLLLIGLAYWLDGNLPAAARFAREAVFAAYNLFGLIDDFLYYVKVASDWSIEAGQFAEARDVLRLVEDEPPRLVSPYLQAALAAWRGTIAIADPQSTATPEAIEVDLRAGIAGYDAFGAVPDRARTQATLGTWLLAQGRPDDAQALLHAAAETYRELGAERWLAELPEGFRECVR